MAQCHCLSPSCCMRRLLAMQNDTVCNLYGLNLKKDTRFKKTLSFQSEEFIEAWHVTVRYCPCLLWENWKGFSIKVYQRLWAQTSLAISSGSCLRSGLHIHIHVHAKAITECVPFLMIEKPERLRFTGPNAVKVDHLVGLWVKVVQSWNTSVSLVNTTSVYSLLELWVIVPWHKNTDHHQWWMKQVQAMNK